jgi:hypothetical protein
MYSGTFHHKTRIIAFKGKQSVRRQIKLDNKTLEKARSLL